MARTLAERLRAHEQQKARLAEAEARLKLDERRQRTRRLVEAGKPVGNKGNPWAAAVNRGVQLIGSPATT